MPETTGDDRPWTGGCACGAIRYATATAPRVEVQCHCRDCQRRSGTGHGSYLTFPERAAVSLTGAAREWRVAGDSGNVKNHGFCPTCGTPVYVTFDAAPEAIAVHAGSLDEPDRFRPRVAVYAIRQYAWDRPDPTLAAFDRMPG